jgi:hypothetical protein
VLQSRSLTQSVFCCQRGCPHITETSNTVVRLRSSRYSIAMIVTRSRVGTRNVNSSSPTSASFPAVDQKTPTMSEQQIEKLVTHQRATGFCPEQLKYMFSLWILSANIRLDKVTDVGVKTLLHDQLHAAALMLHELPAYVNTILRVSATIFNVPHCHDHYVAHISSEQGSFDLASFHYLEPALISWDGFLDTIVHELLTGPELVVGRTEIMRYSVKLLLRDFPVTPTLVDWRVGDTPDSDDGSWGDVWYHVRLHPIDNTFVHRPSAWLQRTDLMSIDQGKDGVVLFEQLLAEAYTSMLYAPSLSRQDQRDDWYVLISASASNSKKRPRSSRSVITNAPNVTKVPAGERLISIAQIGRMNIEKWTAWMLACNSEFHPEIKEEGLCRVPTINPDTGRREWKQVPFAGDWHVRRIIRLVRLLYEAVNGKQRPHTLDSWTKAVDHLFSLCPRTQQELRDMIGGSANDDGKTGSDDSRTSGDEAFGADNKSSEDSSDDEAGPDTSDDETGLDIDLNAAGAEILDDDQAAGLLLTKLIKMSSPQQPSQSPPAADVVTVTPSVKPVSNASISTLPGLMLGTGLLPVPNTPSSWTQQNSLSSVGMALDSDSPAKGPSSTISFPHLVINEELETQFDQQYGVPGRDVHCSSLENLMTPPGCASVFQSRVDSSSSLYQGNDALLMSSEMSWSPVMPSSSRATELSSACRADAPETPHALFQSQPLYATQQCLSQHSDGSTQRSDGLQISTCSTNAGPSSEETKSAVDVAVSLHRSPANSNDNNNSTSHNANPGELIPYHSEGTPSRVVVKDWEDIGQRGLFVCDEFAPGDELGPLIGIEVQQRRSNHSQVFGVRRNNKDVSLDVQGRWPWMINHAPPHLCNVDFDRDTWKVVATRHITRNGQAFFDYGVQYWVDELMEREYEHYEHKLPELLPFFVVMHSRVRTYSWLLRTFRKCNPSDAMRLALITLYLCHQCLRDSASV